MDPAYQQTTLRQEDGHWWYRGRRRVLAPVLASLPLPDQPRILDAGCGGGGQLRALARLGEVTGLEPAAEAAEVAQARGTGNVVQGTIEQLPFGDASFDMITSLDVIEHTDHDVLALGELLRVIRPGGWLVLTVPAYPWLWSRHDELNHHRRRYTRSTLLRATAAAGWAPRRTTHFNSLLLPAAAAVRLVERRDSSQRSDVDRTPAWLNGLLEMPLAMEARLISSGRRLPAGLSLLGVFQAPAAWHSAPRLHDLPAHSRADAANAWPRRSPAPKLCDWPRYTGSILQSSPRPTPEARPTRRPSHRRLASRPPPPAGS